ncbi:MAG TPA: aldehyde dehydrogenase family protein [Phycisphaerae bacterium]|nr:aldehyde dehydrogenase family protein [Phycisphaerae bacterium]
MSTREPLPPSLPYWLASESVAAPANLFVTDKFTGETCTRVAQADSAAIEKAITRAAAAVDACRKMPSHARAGVLHHVVRRLGERAEEFARVLAGEVGKPIRDARGEVERAIDTFRIAAEEATRITGEYLPLDISPRAEGCEAICKRVPIGVCAFITPFNFPLNLAAHKIAPAIAAGCPWLLKPASLTPISALMLGEILAETDWPRGAFSILPCKSEDAGPLTTDDRIKLLSFTGSPEVGWRLKSKAGKKRVVLELGGNAACIVDEGADLDYAVSRLIVGAFYQSGQSCISVQRIIAHRSVYDPLKTKLAAAAAKLKSGDPLEEETFLGPMITESDAQRVEQWVGDAVQRGARVLCGGRRNGGFYDATLVENVPDDLPLSCREVFGPVAILEPFDDFADACRRVNASRYGLQAGLFTRNIDAAFYAFNELDVGGVILNDVPAFRVDSMPYGGVKDSGLGREGVRYAIEEMTEPRLLVLSKVGRKPG